jgi:uncharacterized protein (TIGR01777 family)
MAKILITGGSGLLGLKVTAILKQRGYEPIWLSRHPHDAEEVNAYHWDPSKKELDTQALQEVKHLVLLAGAGILDKRWTPSRKKILEESRVLGNELLLKALIEKNATIESVVGSSAIGYYGQKQRHGKLSESDPAGEDYPAHLCQGWEKSQEAFSTLGARVVTARFGIVLSHRSGAYPQLANPARLGFRLIFGSGQQPFTWVHENDAANFVTDAIFNQKSEGVYNVLSPEIVTQEKLSEKLCQSFGRKGITMRVPAALLRFRFGESSDMLLKGNEISNKRLQDAKFKLLHPHLDETLRDLASKF